MEDEILDLPEFMERVQDDKELLLELLDIFAADYQVKRAALTEAIDKSDTGQLKSIAHSLKGASGNISAKKLREIFLKIEECVKANNLAGVKPLLAHMDSAYANLTNRFEEVKKELA